MAVYDVHFWFLPSDFEEIPLSLESGHCAVVWIHLDWSSVCVHGVQVHVHITSTAQYEIV